MISQRYIKVKVFVKPVQDFIISLSKRVFIKGVKEYNFAFIVIYLKTKLAAVWKRYFMIFFFTLISFYFLFLL